MPSCCPISHSVPLFFKFCFSWIQSKTVFLTNQEKTSLTSKKQVMRKRDSKSWEDMGRVKPGDCPDSVYCLAHIQQVPSTALRHRWLCPGAICLTVALLGTGQTEFSVWRTENKPISFGQSASSAEEGAESRSWQTMGYHMLFGPGLKCLHFILCACRKATWHNMLLCLIFSSRWWLPISQDHLEGTKAIRCCYFQVLKKDDRKKAMSLITSNCLGFVVRCQDLTVLASRIRMPVPKCAMS